MCSTVEQAHGRQLPAQGEKIVSKALHGIKGVAGAMLAGSDACRTCLAKHQQGMAEPFIEV